MESPRKLVPPQNNGGQTCSMCLLPTSLVLWPGRFPLRRLCSKCLVDGPLAAAPRLQTSGSSSASPFLWIVAAFVLRRFLSLMLFLTKRLFWNEPRPTCDSGL